MPKKYNVTTVDKNGKTYQFVTRGRSKPFSDEEIVSFFDKKDEQPIKSTFKVEGSLRRIFSQDLKFGFEYCSQKYGASHDEILIEAKRLFPQLNLDRIIGSIKR